MRDYQRYATIVAVFATVLFLAAVVAAFGLISLATNLEVIPAPEAGPLLGPIMTVAAGIVVFVLLLLLGVRTKPELQRIVLGYSAGVGVAALAVFVLTGAILVAIDEGSLFGLLGFAAQLLSQPFAWALAILAFVIAVVYSWILAARMTERGRPLWPWERRGE